MTVATHVFQYFGTSIDNVLASYVSRTSARVASFLTPLVTTAVTLWVVAAGWSMMTEARPAALPHLAARALRISVILAVALGSGVYQQQVVTDVDSLSDGLVAAASDSGATNAYAALDHLNDEGAELGIAIAGRGEDLLPIGGYVDIAVGLAVVAINAVTVVTLGLNLLFGKLSLALVLAFGPLFIAALAFPATAPWFARWASAVLSAVLLFAMASAVCSMAVIIYGHYLESAAGQSLEAISAVRQLAEIIIFGGSMIVLAFRIPGLASSMVGGASHGAVSTAVGIFYTAPRALVRAGGGRTSAGIGTSGVQGSDSGRTADSAATSPPWRAATLSASTRNGGAREPW